MVAGKLSYQHVSLDADREPVASNHPGEPDFHGSTGVFESFTNLTC